MQADGLEDLENGENRGDDGDPWPGTTGKHEFDNTSTPNSKFHEGTPSNLDLHVDDNSCASTMHVDVSHLGDASPVPVPPANDNFADAVALAGNSGSTTGSNDNGTLETGEVEVAGHGGASVWYTWTPTTSGTATVTMADSDFDTVLGIFTGSAVNALTLVAENDDEDNANEIYTSKVVTHVTAGTTYRVAADGYDGDTGSIHLAWSVVADPLPVPTVTAVHAPDPSVVRGGELGQRHGVRQRRHRDRHGHPQGGRDGHRVGYSGRQRPRHHRAADHDHGRRARADRVVPG